MASESEAAQSALERSALRVDARHNRDRVLCSARELFRENGLEVSMAEVARRAGVGMATLYRRFPSKQALVTEVFRNEFRTCVALAEEALAEPEPGRAFAEFLRAIATMQLRDRGFTAAFASAYPHVDETFEATRAQMKERFATLTSRGQQAGRIRRDFDPEDIQLIMLANEGIAAVHPQPVRASERLISYLLNALMLPSTTTTP